MGMMKSIEHELKKNQKSLKLLLLILLRVKELVTWRQPKWHANWPSPEFEKQAIEELSK